MKYFAFLTLFIIALYLIGFIKRPKRSQWMDMNYTTAIKGFSILTVVWAYCGARLSVGGIQFIAGIGVALFLICSGYGLEGFWKKRLLGVCLPFWIVELIGLLTTVAFSVKTYVLDFIFFNPATGYGWFMGYIIICYLIFYVVKRFVPNKSKYLILIFFVVWFVLESFFFANPDMPFLRARQMLSFPCGMLLAMNKDKIEHMLTKRKIVLIVFGGGIMCLSFMAVTQLPAVKELHYIVLNAMALLTCFPMAIGILVLGKIFNVLFENCILIAIGTVSYEIYLVHAFTLSIVRSSLNSIFAFIILTAILAYITYFTMGKIKNGKFNNYYPYKK